jgi:hypothetical protein
MLKGMTNFLCVPIPDHNLSKLAAGYLIVVAREGGSEWKCTSKRMRVIDKVTATGRGGAQQDRNQAR